MRAILKSIAKKLVYVIVTCIILLAILVSVSQLFSPTLDKHRADFEKWASQLLGMPVTIEKIRISWYRYQPEISLREVTILSQETKEPLLQIENVSVFFSIPKSLWQRQFVPNGIMISGTDVNVHEVAKGEFSVQGFPSFGGFNTTPYQHESKFTDVMTWVSTQPRLILNDINIRYTGFTGQKRFLTLNNLSVINGDDRHVIIGKAILHQDIPTEITASVNWIGKSIDLSQIRARIYLYVSGLSLSQWFKGYSWNNWQIMQGIGSAKIWATWNHGAFQKTQSTFQLYDLQLYSSTDKSTHTINRLSGNTGWKREGQNWVFAGDDILIDLPSHLWPVTSFYVSLAPDANGVLVPKAANLGYADIQDVQSFLFSSPAVISDAVRKALGQLQLSGALQNAVATFSGPLTDLKNISLNANFNQLSFLPWHQVPGVSNLSGIVKWDGMKGNMSLHSTRAQFKYDSIFNNPIDLDQLTGSIEWQQDQNKAWQFQIKSLQMLNNDGAANINGSISIPAETYTPSTDLSANFTMQKASHVPRYLPMKIFDRDLAKWLQTAFLSGEVRSGKAVLRGSLNDFPFDQGNGTFLITGAVKNVDMIYATNWPEIRSVNGTLTFSGRQMSIDVSDAKVLDVPISNVHGEIPYFGDLKPQILTIQGGEITMDFTQGLKFLRASPLKNTIGKMVTDMTANGPITLKLGLTVPLSNPDKTEVQGDVTMKDDNVSLVPWKLTLNHLNGQFHFTEGSVTADNIQAELFNKPAQLSFKTIQKSKNVSVIQANLANNLSITDLENWLKIPFSKVAKGSADVNCEIDFSFDAPIEIVLRSNLVGISLDLPDQYAKKEQDPRNFFAQITVQEERQPLRIKLSYDDLLGAALVLNRKQEEFNLIGANLQLGGGLPNWPAGAGLYITANFNQLDWDKIKGYTEQSGNANFANLPLRKIDIKAKVLDILGQRLTDAHIQVEPAQSNWNINLQSQEVVGNIKAPSNFTSKGSVTAKFQKLNLRTTQDTKQSNPVTNAKSLPSISFDASNVSYNDMPLGQVSFKTSPSSNGLTIQSLRMTSSRMDLQASGEWTQSNVTRLQGTLKSSNVSNLLNSFGMDVRNFISSNGRLDFKFNWNSAPYSPSLPMLNGTASLDLGKGRILEVGEASGAKMDIGRMLSIFSLQSIPRRLSLDFSDVFQKGYVFDYVRGNFSLKNGDAYTNDMRFDGPLARVGINGRIGLKNKDYDFTLSITPYNVTSGLPVAATLLSAGNPVVGLAAFAVNTVISPAVSRAATYYYSVKGPWNNPSWQSVSSNRR